MSAMTGTIPLPRPHRRPPMPLLLDAFPAPPSHLPSTPLTPNTPNLNPPPSRPPSLPLPPVPGPSRISESDTLLFLSSSTSLGTHSRRSTKISLSSTYSEDAASRDSIISTSSSSRTRSNGRTSPKSSSRRTSFSSTSTRSAHQSPSRSTSVRTHLSPDQNQLLTRLTISPAPLSDLEDDEDNHPRPFPPNFSLPFSYASPTTVPRAISPSPSFSISMSNPSTPSHRLDNLEPRRRINHATNESISSIDMHDLPSDDGDDDDDDVPTTTALTTQYNRPPHKIIPHLTANSPPRARTTKFIFPMPPSTPITPIAATARQNSFSDANADGLNEPISLPLPPKLGLILASPTSPFHSPSATPSSQKPLSSASGLRGPPTQQLPTSILSPASTDTPVRRFPPIAMSDFEEDLTGEELAMTTTAAIARAKREVRSSSPDIGSIIKSTPRPRRKSSTTRGSLSRSASRSRETRASNPSFSSGRNRGRSRANSSSSASWAGEEDDYGVVLGPGQSDFGTKDAGYGFGFDESHIARRLSPADTDGSNISRLEKGQTGSDSDSSIDLHTPLPHLMLRHGLLSSNSKLLPQNQGKISISTSTVDGRPGSTMSLVSQVGSIMTKSGVMKDERDTVTRRIRHRDGRLLRGGIGLTTGLGWSDSEDEDAPSPLTRRISSLNLSRQSSVTSITAPRLSASTSNPHPLSRSYSNGINLDDDHADRYTNYRAGIQSARNSGDWSISTGGADAKRSASAASSVAHQALTQRRRKDSEETPTTAPPTAWSNSKSKRTTSNGGLIATSDSRRARLSIGGDVDRVLELSIPASTPRRSLRSDDSIVRTPSSASSLSIPTPLTPQDDYHYSHSNLSPSASKVNRGDLNKNKTLPPLPGGLKRPASRSAINNSSRITSPSPTPSSLVRPRTYSSASSNGTSSVAPAYPTPHSNYRTSDALPRTLQLARTGSHTISGDRPAVPVPTVSYGGRLPPGSVTAPVTPIEPTGPSVLHAPAMSQSHSTGTIRTSLPSNLRTPASTSSAAKNGIINPRMSEPIALRSIPSSLRLRTTNSVATLKQSHSASSFASVSDRSTAATTLISGTGMKLTSATSPIEEAPSKPRPRIGAGMAYRTSTHGGPTKMQLPTSIRLAQSTSASTSSSALTSRVGLPTRQRTLGMSSSSASGV